ncbi:hypothetical protein RUM43_009237, partial [Polyplax serrata]
PEELLIRVRAYFVWCWTRANGIVLGRALRLELLGWTLSGDLGLWLCVPKEDNRVHPGVVDTLVP